MLMFAESYTEGGFMKPKEYRDPYTLTRNAPYLTGEGGTPRCGGVLNIGRAVYLQEGTKEKRLSGPVSAYAEGIGVILVDSRFLMRTYSPEFGGTPSSRPNDTTFRK
jgi:hypothetical protein